MQQPQHDNGINQDGQAVQSHHFGHFLVVSALCQENGGKFENKKHNLKKGGRCPSSSTTPIIPAVNFE